ncbi:pyrroloquinoline quinone biosynthesis protein B [Limimonas halophila]|uniref:Coenzyme PQQ synthesis protein B n=1 Tax=Limimonas halophila TaxID=1082479 RepID=A0A1G7RK42_9PROT|nr:pyrroloquinoline quinone biosynthesis protein PqqB [Limimonas halophila]SDG10569.1 pyrroloquinoline quinone biosynthesis protein B [Limimonas halophila]
MRAIVLGSAAGGGFPQWNCGCGNCARAWRGDPDAVPRTQSALAVTADERRWLLLNASPDLRQQILTTPALHPRSAPRGSPIAAVAVTNADVDHLAGLLTLRESQPLALYGTARAHAALTGSPVFEVLDRATVSRRELPLEATTPVHDAEGAGIGLWLTAFAVPGKVARYLETGDDPAALAGSPGDTIGLAVADADGRRMVYIPGCAAVDQRVTRRVAGAEALFFDGTLYRDDELIRAGLGAKTGARMGHVPVAGPGGSMAALADVKVRRRVYVHVNNSNPMIRADTPERAEVEAAGWTVAFDGLEVAA